MSAATIPELAPATGDALGADVARGALTANDDAAVAPELTARGSETDNGGSDSSEPAGATSSETSGDSTDDLPPAGGPSVERRPQRIPKAGTLARKHSRVELARMVVELHERHRDDAARVEDMTRQLATASAVDAETIDASVEDMVGDVVGLVDTAAQLSVGEPYADAVALDDEETARLKTLGARVAKIKLGAAVQQSPTLALIVGAASIALAKVIAYRLAVREREQQAGTTAASRELSVTTSPRSRAR